MSGTRAASPGSRVPELVVAVLVAIGLVVDAVIHLRLASGYQAGQSAGLGTGNIFRIQSVVALASAAFVLIRGSRLSYVIAAVVGISAVVALVLYRYVDVPTIGPLPSMYEPIWYTEKALSGVAEALAGLLALVGVARPRVRSRRD